MTTTPKTELETNRKERLVFYTNRRLKELILLEAKKQNISVSMLLQLEMFRKMVISVTKSRKNFSVSFQTSFSLLFPWFPCPRVSEVISWNRQYDRKLRIIWKSACPSPLSRIPRWSRLSSPFPSMLSGFSDHESHSFRISGIDPLGLTRLMI